MEKKKSIGVSVLGWYEIVAGVHTYVIYHYFILPKWLAKLFMQSNLSYLSLDVTGAAFAALSIIVGVFTLKMRKEACMLNVIYGSLFIVSFVYSALLFFFLVMKIPLYTFQMHQLYFFKRLIFGAIVIYYFTRPKIKEQFK